MKFEICWRKKKSYKSAQLHTEVLLNLHTLWYVSWQNLLAAMLYLSLEISKQQSTQGKLQEIVSHKFLPW